MIFSRFFHFASVPVDAVMTPCRRSTVFSETLLSPPDNHTHSWDADIHLRSELGPVPYTTVWLVSEFLTLVALLVFLPAACTKQSCGATAFPCAVVASIVSFILCVRLWLIFMDIKPGSLYADQSLVRKFFLSLSCWLNYLKKLSSKVILPWAFCR